MIQSTCYVGDNYVPEIFESYSPELPWNPQRPDQITPHFRLYGNQQCMGNLYQNLQNYLGLIDKSVADLAHTNTYTYYAQFEWWLKQKNIKPGSNEIYVSEQHCAFLNEMLELNKSPYRVNVLRVPKWEELMGYHERNSRPAGLGTLLSPKGHIVMSVSPYKRGTKDEGLVVDDFFGRYPYRQSMGYHIVYSRDFLEPKLTHLVLIEKV